MDVDVDMNMDVDRDDSPSAGSDVSQVSFVNDFKTLPASGPASHAHLINLSEYVGTANEDSTFKLQDAAVTALFSLSPSTLRSFLSPTVNTFKAIFGKRDVQLIIWRKGSEVFVRTPLNPS